jgi:AraC-like DNA-binding protein
MTILSEERPSDSSYVESVTRGWTVDEGSTIRPAEIHWHMVFVEHPEGVHSFIVGPHTGAGMAIWGKDAQLLWIKFKLGVFLPHLSARDICNSQQALPVEAGRRFWFRGAVQQFPDFETVETFIDRLVRGGDLVYDPVVSAALQGEAADLSPRTLRGRFLRATGQTHYHIRQFDRAQRAADLLRQGVPILETVHAAGYYDQPHLTRSLKQFLGYTPAQILRESQQACQNIQDNLLLSGYDADVDTFANSHQDA